MPDLQILDADEFSAEKVKPEIQKIIGDLSNDTMDFIASYIQDGYKNTLAKLLIYIGDEKAREVLKKMPDGLAAELSERKAKLDGAKPSDGEIAVEGAFILKDYDDEKIKKAIESLNKLDFHASPLKEECKNLFDTNPYISLKLEDSTFSFDDLVILDDRSIQKVLREVDQQELAKALKGADEEVQDKIFRNMSHRAADMLREDMEFMGPVRLKDVIESQMKIVSIILRLEEYGDIVIARSDEDELVN